MKLFNIGCLTLASATTITVLLISSSANELFAQTGDNLIRNWSFEELKPQSNGNTYCPTGTGQLHLAKHWNASVRPASYFHGCSNDTYPNYGMPVNLYGYQGPFDGEACGLVGSYVATTDNFRAFIFQELEAPLVAGHQYRMQFHVNLADSVNFAMSGMGALLSVENTRFWEEEDFFNAVPQVLNPWENLLDDKEGWTVISGIFTAQGGEKYLSIGCFRRDTDDNIQRVSDHPTGSFSWEGSSYFVDGVELYWDRDIGIDDPENNSIKLYPNPTEAVITIETERGVNVLEMFDMSGRSVLHSSLSSPKEIIDISHFPQGVYVVAVTLRDGSVVRQRLVKK